MLNKISYFEDRGAYSTDMIAKVLSRSGNYVEGKLTGIEPCTEISSEAGPYARAWGGSLLNQLVIQKKLSKKLPAGTIVWKDKQQNAFTSVYEMTIK